MTHTDPHKKTPHRHDEEQHHSRSQETSFCNTDRQRSHQSNNMSNFDDSRSQGSSKKTSNRHDNEQHQGIQRQTSFEKFAEERD